MSASSQRFANQLKMVDKDAAVIAAADDAYRFVDWINCSRFMICDPRLDFMDFRYTVPVDII